MAEKKGPSAEILKALETAPNMYLVLTPDLYIITASDAYLEATQTTREMIAGKHIFEAFPDNPDLPDGDDGMRNINASLQTVLQTKKPDYMRVQRYDVPDIQNPGKFIARYWDPSHTPVLDENGDISYIIQLATNVTDKILTERALLKSQLEQIETMEQMKALNEELLLANNELRETQQNLSLLNNQLEERILQRTRELAASEERYRSRFNDEQALNEELAATNEEQAATNEKLTASNEELLRMQEVLRDLTNEKQAAIDRLRANDENIRNMVRQAPVGMCIVEGEPLYMVEINNAFLEIIGKTREEVKKPYWEVVPEAEAYYRPVTERVFVTGETYHANEHEIILVRHGKEEIVHIDFVYEPMKDSAGKVYAIMIVAIDITDKVLARRKVERAEESLRMAVDAAGLGTYYINATDRIFHPSPRLKEFFGFLPDEEVPYDAAMNQIHPDYRQKVADMVEAAFTKGENFDMEYPIIGFHDGSIRWVRGIGTMQHYDGKDFFTGVLHEITESKKDEIRKNDFIGMVSHELKTPLTSLNAIIQVSNAKLKNSEDPFLVGAMEKANGQVRRMSTMINGFLNISRLESGKILIEKEQFDLEALIREIADESRLTATTHQFSTDLCLPVKVMADRDKINSVVTNLISNAIKYSPKGSIITVACDADEKHALVSIKDEGIGIKPEEAAKIFDRYYRVESGNMKHISGFGIGLYLSAEIIQRHGGEIWVESQYEKGSTFKFKLPLK